MGPFFKSNYYEFTKEFKRKLIYNAGLIIYPDKDEIPQDVLFIPHERNFDLSFEEDVNNALKEVKSNIIIAYFQGMRWHQKDLKDVLIKCPNLKARIGGDRIFIDSNVRISFGIIVSDITYNDKRPLADIETIQHVELEFGSNNFKFNCIDIPNSFGVPSFFIDYNPENYFHIKQ